MRFDFFELVESIFKGFVFFVYNMVASLWALIRRPHLAPARLHRAYLQKDAKQIGSLTLLFMTLFAAYSVINSGVWQVLTIGNPYSSVALDRLVNSTRELATTPPTFDLNSVWGRILGALLATVAIDAAARLILNARVNRSTRRSMLLSAFEYSLVRPILILLLTPLCIIIFIELIEFDLAAWTILPAFGIILLGLGFAVAASRRSLEWLCRRSGNQRAPARPSRVVRVTAQLGLTAYVALAVVGGGWTASQIDAKSESSQSLETTRLVIPSLEAIAVECVLDVAEPYVEVALVNLTPTPVVIYPARQLDVSIYRIGADRAPVYPTTPVAVRGIVGSNASFQTFSPNETRTLRFRLALDGPVDPALRNCRFRSSDILLQLFVEPPFLLQKSARLLKTDPYWQK